MTSVNSRKDPKNAGSNDPNRLKLGKMFRKLKTYCVQKCKKNEYREFDHSGTL